MIIMEEVKGQKNNVMSMEGIGVEAYCIVEMR
jgi:hypothetical protein